MTKHINSMRKKQDFVEIWHCFGQTSWKYGIALAKLPKNTYFQKSTIHLQPVKTAKFYAQKPIDREKLTDLYLQTAKNAQSIDIFAPSNPLTLL